MTTPRDPHLSSDDVTRARAAVLAKIARRRHRRVVRRTAVGAVAGIAAIAAVATVVGFGLPSHTAPTTLAVQSPPQPPPAAASSFPPPVNSALAYLASRTQVPLEGPTTLPTNPDHLQLSATVTASPDSYSVQLNRCAETYPLDPPTINGPTFCEKAGYLGVFGGQSFTTPPAARRDLPKLAGFGDPYPPGVCSTGASHLVSLGNGMTGRVFPSDNSCITWTQGGWTFYIYVYGGPTASALTGDARPIVTYVHAHPLPGSGGVLNETAGGEGDTTLTAWTVGDNDYTASNNQSAIGALEQVGSMQPTALVPRPTPPPANASKKHLTASIQLDTTTVTAGRSISGHLVVDNPTGATVMIGRSCGPGAEFQMGLIGNGLVDEPGDPLCTEPIQVEPGLSYYPIMVTTSFDFCVGTASEATKQVPYCKDSLLPPLPPGKYRATLVTAGIKLSNVASVPVTLVPAHS